MANRKVPPKSVRHIEPMIKRSGRRISHDYEYNPFEDPVYIHQMQEVMSENLEKGNNVLSMANGDLVVTETKVVQFVFKWDREKKKLTKSIVGKTSDKNNK